MWGSKSTGLICNIRTRLSEALSLSQYVTLRHKPVNSIETLWKHFGLAFARYLMFGESLAQCY